MEELRMLLEMVAKLPTMAVWVLLGIFAYKVVIVGSIFGVLRLLIIKMHDWLTRPPQHKYVEIRPMLDGLCVSGTKDELMHELKRLRGVNVCIDSSYIHPSTVDWLREAIDARLLLDAQAKAKKTP
jgi:hypothetical protein